jgi:hypothetical protein
MTRRRLLHLVAVMLGSTSLLARAQEGSQPRLLVLTDISSITAGVAEPDDAQSLIRLMLYTNDLKIEGLIATANLGHGQKTRPDLIHQVVDAYEEVRPNLRLHDSRYPPADVLRNGIKSGQERAGPKFPVTESVGEGRDTQASDWIIKCVDRPHPSPLWIVVWGGSADLAQALLRVRQSRTPKELREFVSRLRVHSIGDQDSTGPWIREQFPDLFAITQRRAYRGMYRGGDVTLVSSDWVLANVRGRGALGDLYPNYHGGDIWSAKLGPVRGIKEGDTPSFLSLLPNGLSDFAHPWLGSWGGRFRGGTHQLTDIPDSDLDTKGDPDPRMSSVYRWREAFQADFAARLNWCVKSYNEANHSPIVQINEPPSRSIQPGGSIGLDASRSRDPDGNSLTFEWGIYPSDPAIAKLVNFRGGETSTPQIDVGDLPAGTAIPILLAAKDNGTPSLTRYARMMLVIGTGDSQRR